MPVKRFPPIESADEDGLLAVGGDLAIESVLLAYQNGIFPWPISEEMLAWFSPPERAVIFLEEFHRPRSLKRSIKKRQFVSKRDCDFRGVISRCAEVVNRGDQHGTWITSDIIRSYCELFERGHCHSFETYLNGELVGGLYGIQIGRFFAAESSFFRETDASKVAMCDLVEYLTSIGATWFDCQMLTPFSVSFGAREISREEYMSLLAEATKDSVAR